MVARLQVDLICDICSTEDLVHTHTLVVDNKKVEGEACDPCWGQVEALLSPLMKAGRTEPRRRKRKK